MNEHYLESICNILRDIQQTIDSATTENPFQMLNGKLHKDGNQWCALYGENIQEGICGFGETPAKAVSAFNLNYWNQN